MTERPATERSPLDDTAPDAAPDATPDAGHGPHAGSGGDVRTPPQRVGDETKVPLEGATWRREGTDAPDAADIDDRAGQL